MPVPPPPSLPLQKAQFKKKEHSLRERLEAAENAAERTASSATDAAGAVEAAEARASEAQSDADAARQRVEQLQDEMAALDAKLAAQASECDDAVTKVRH